MLSKTVCKKCKSIHGDTVYALWEKKDERLWKWKKMVYCPLSLYNCQSGLPSFKAEVKKVIPHYCPYKFEHLITGQENVE